MKNGEDFVNFVNEVKENGKMWLLQAKDGLFAMLEDNNGNSYVPVWSNEESASECVNDDWTDYSLTAMSLRELMKWLNELSEDHIGIAVSPDKDGSMFPMRPEDIRSIFKDSAKSDKELVGEEFFDEKWSDWDGDLDSLEEDDDEA